MNGTQIAGPWGAVVRLRATLEVLVRTAKLRATAARTELRGRIEMKDRYAEARPSSWFAR